MYHIDKKPYGLHLTFAGHIPKHEMERWQQEITEVLAAMDAQLGVFVDMRDLELLPPESRPAMMVGQRTARKHGMQRSVVILRDKITALQFKGIAKETGIYAWERYIDADAEPNWEQVGLDWILNAVDPDHKAEPATSGHTSR